jgi:hypothetical protein
MNFLPSGGSRKKTTSSIDYTPNITYWCSMRVGSSCHAIWKFLMIHTGGHAFTAADRCHIKQLTSLVYLWLPVCVQCLSAL